MTRRYYAANDGKAILQVITELGRDHITISVGNKHLDWKSIELDEDQAKAFKLFMRENDV